jgi:insulysin
MCFSQFDFDAIKQCLGFLTDDKFRLIFVAKEISENLPETERWYGTKYSCEGMSESLLKVGRPSHSLLILQTIKSHPRIPELRMPDPNPFIPKNFTVHQEVDTVRLTDGGANELSVKYPMLLRDSPTKRIWFKKDSTFWVPKLTACILLRT